MRTSARILSLSTLCLLGSPVSALSALPDLGSSICTVPQGPNVGTQVCGANYVESHAKQFDSAAGGSGGATSLAYVYDVVDTTDRLVDVTLSYELFAQSVGDAFDVRGVASHEAEASISVGSADLSFSDAINAISAAGNLVATNGGTLQSIVLHVQTNTKYVIVMHTSAVSVGAGEAIAFVDPSISLDPAMYPEASVAVSDGISNTVATDVIVPIVSTVPEPGTAGLMLGGLCALTLVRRRKNP
jgi:hypothetical protein